MSGVADCTVKSIHGHGHGRGRFTSGKDAHREGRAIVTQHKFTWNPLERRGRTPRATRIAIAEAFFRRATVPRPPQSVVDGFKEGVILWYPKKPSARPAARFRTVGPCCRKTGQPACSSAEVFHVTSLVGAAHGSGVDDPPGRSRLGRRSAQEQNLDVASIDPNPLPAILKIRIDPYP
jgi:hypothetical protein